MANKLFWKVPLSWGAINNAKSYLPLSWIQSI